MYMYKLLVVGQLLGEKYMYMYNSNQIQSQYKRTKPLASPHHLNWVYSTINTPSICMHYFASTHIHVHACKCHYSYSARVHNNYTTIIIMCTLVKKTWCPMIMTRIHTNLLVHKFTCKMFYCTFSKILHF